MSKSLSSGTKLVSGAFEGEVMSRLPVSTCLIISTSPPSCMFGKTSRVALPPVASWRCSAIISSPRSMGSPSFWECPALSTMSAAPTTVEDNAPPSANTATMADISNLRMVLSPACSDVDKDGSTAVRSDRFRFGPGRGQAARAVRTPRSASTLRSALRGPSGRGRRGGRGSPAGIPTISIPARVAET